MEKGKKSTRGKKKTSSSSSAKRKSGLGKIVELADKVGLKTLRLPSRIGAEAADEELRYKPRAYRRWDDERDSVSVSASDKKVLAEHKRLYELLSACSDPEEFSRIYKRYAELDVKVARIKNRDVAALERCAYENNYSVVK